MTHLHSLRWRLMVALLLVFALGSGVSAIFSYGEAYGTLKELSKRTLEGQARELVAGLRFRPDGGSGRLPITTRRSNSSRNMPLPRKV